MHIGAEMITENTVFIIGAGASVPYGYPTGKGLRKIICQKIPDVIGDYYVDSYGHTTDSLKDRVKLGAKELAAVFFKSSTPSIDLFLHRNHSFVDIGKMAISLAILLSEEKSVFREDIGNTSEDWYSYLFERISSELSEPDSYPRFAENQVSFITFNYDRSLEHFIYESFINSFCDQRLGDQMSLSAARYQEYIPFPFIHVYGLIDDAQWHGGHYYGEEDAVKNFTKLSHNIKVIGEERPGEEIDLAKDLIGKAKKVFFLGFGFAEENVKVLDLPNTLHAKQNVYGTAVGMSVKERNRKLKALNPNRRKVDNISEDFSLCGTMRLSKVGCRDLLRDWL